MNAPRRFWLLLLALGAACGGADPEVARLLRALEQGQPEGRAIADLGPQDSAALPELIKLLDKDRRRFVQVPLIAALRNIGSLDAAPALQRAMDYPDPVVGFSAAAALWTLTREATPGLDVLVQGVLDSSSSAVAAIDERVGPLPPAALDRLVKGARGSDGNWLRCIEAIGRVGPTARETAPALVELLERPEARTTAALALYRVSGESETAVRSLLGIYRSVHVFERRDASLALLEIGRNDPAALIGPVRGLLTESEADLRSVGAWLLGQLGPPAAEALDELRSLAQDDPSVTVRQAASAAVEAIATPR